MKKLIIFLLLAVFLIGCKTIPTEDRSSLCDSDIDCGENYCMGNTVYMHECVKDSANRGSCKITTFDCMDGYPKCNTVGNVVTSTCSADTKLCTDVVAPCPSGEKCQNGKCALDAMGSKSTSGIDVEMLLYNEPERLRWVVSLGTPDYSGYKLEGRMKYAGVEKPIATEFNYQSKSSWIDKNQFPPSTDGKIEFTVDKIWKGSIPYDVDESVFADDSATESKHNFVFELKPKF